MYTILTLWSQLQNKRVHALPLICIYHTDSVESTSKFFFVSHRFARRYTILTLWSQLQNVCAWEPTLIYYTILTLWSQLQNRGQAAQGAAGVYHTDSVESTSKSPSEMGTRSSCYTILTLWSQLQNAACCTRWRLLGYTILTLWSQLQNELQKLDEQFVHIPYWLCGVNFKMEQHSLAQNIALYHTDSVESTSKWRTIRRGVCRGIPYWLCGVNFKIPPRTAKASLPLYHTDSVESTSK